MPRIEFDVAGIPITQGNKTPVWSETAQKPIVLEGRNSESRARFYRWRADVQAAALPHRLALRGHKDSPLRVTLAFRLPRPKSRPDDVWSSTRPDLDKLARAVHDGLEAGKVLANDSRIAQSATSKRFVGPDDDGPGVHVVIETIDHAEGTPW